MRKIQHRVYFSDREMKFSAAKLRKEIEKAGYTLSHSAFFRAKKMGWFAPNYPKSSKSRASVRYADGRVYLSVSERTMRPVYLVEKFGISQHLARVAKRRGWFEVNRYNRNLVDIPRGRLSKRPPT